MTSARLSNMMVPSDWVADYLDRLTRDPAGCQGGGRLDTFIVVHNNTAMSSVRLTPAVVLINLASSLGATG
jgi:hypothetical protein